MSLLNFRDALSGDRICFGELIRYGEILSSTLPQEHRKYDLAEDCLLSAMTLIPDNSKVHHRLGILYLCEEVILNFPTSFTSTC